MKTIQIQESQLEEVFSSLKTTKELCDIYENRNEVLYEKYLAEFVGIFCTLNTLGLDEEWYKWQVKHGDEE